MNEPASNGFFQYRIRLHPDVPLGTVVKNRAAIYFDFNAPVITNETYHTIGEDFITVSIGEIAGSEAVKLTVVPNPFRHAAELIVGRAEHGTKILQLYDLHGRLVRQSEFSGPRYRLERGGLLPGIYVLRLLDERNQLSVTAKLVIETRF